MPDAITALIGLLALALMLPVSLWVVSCPTLVANQRIMLVKRRPQKINRLYKKLVKEWEAVSFSAHVHAVMFFRNPKLLYGPETQKIWPSGQ